MNEPFVVFLVIICYTLASCDPDPFTADYTYDCHTNNAPEVNHPNSEKFDEFLEGRVADGLPGISMLIQSPEGFYQGAAGLADISNKVAMEPCHVHRIGSITKQFTAAIVMTLYQRGDLDLDDKITEYLPLNTLSDIANAASTTIKQLLTHSSGIPDVYDIDFWLEYFNDPYSVTKPISELEYSRKVDADFTSGTRWHYSNTNYILLHLIAESITDKSYEELLHELIIEPLNLQNTYFSNIGIQPDNVVRGYTDDYGNGLLRDVTNYSFGVANGTGGIFSNVYDLYLFQREFVYSEILWQQEILDELLYIESLPFHDPEFWNFGEENGVKGVRGIAMGWLELVTDLGPALGHNGGLMGRKARAWYFPDSETHIVFLINGDGGKVDEVSRDLFRNGMIELLTI